MPRQYKQIHFALGQILYISLYRRNEASDEKLDTKLLLKFINLGIVSQDPRSIETTWNWLFFKLSTFFVSLITLII